MPTKAPETKKSVACPEMLTRLLSAALHLERASKRAEVLPAWRGAKAYRRGHCQRNRLLGRFSDPILGPHPALDFQDSYWKLTSFSKTR